MLALTLTQPWASLVAFGEKRIETRSWQTRLTGDIAIHAAKGWPRWAMEFALSDESFRHALIRHGVTKLGELPRGAVVAIAHLDATIPVEQLANDPRLTDRERRFGDYSPGRYGLVLSNIRPLVTPVPARGALGFWSWDAPYELASLSEVAA